MAKNIGWRQLGGHGRLKRRQPFGHHEGKSCRTAKPARRKPSPEEGNEGKQAPATSVSFRTSLHLTLGYLGCVGQRYPMSSEPAEAVF